MRPSRCDARPSAAQRGYDSAWRRFRLGYAQVEAPICADCGKALPLRFMHLDHVKALDQGGAKFDPANLAWRCYVCHAKKTATEDGGFGRPSAAKCSTPGPAAAPKG